MSPHTTLKLHPPTLPHFPPGDLAAHVIIAAAAAVSAIARPYLNLPAPGALSPRPSAACRPSHEQGGRPLAPPPPVLIIQAATSMTHPLRTIDVFNHVYHWVRSLARLYVQRCISCHVMRVQRCTLLAEPSGLAGLS